MTQYKFKHHPLSDAERIWITNAANTDKFDPKVAKVHLFGKIPVDFDPRTLDPRLYVSGKLTPIGLWHLNPDDPILSALDKIVISIRELILDRPGVEKVTATDIAHRTQLPEEDVELALSMLGYLGSFYSSANGGTDPNRLLSIDLTGDTAYDEYLRYESLEDLLERRYVASEPGSASVDQLQLMNLFAKTSGDKLFGSGGTEIERKLIKTNTAFVIMAIDPSHAWLEDVYNTIKEVFGKFGILARRADEIQHQDRITDVILREIRECEFLIADLSLERPNVYYEIGYAHAENKRPILIRKTDTKLHFDLSIHNAPEYKNMTDLREILTRRLQEVLGRDPKDNTK